MDDELVGFDAIQAGCRAGRADAVRLVAGAVPGRQTLVDWAEVRFTEAQDAGRIYPTYGSKIERDRFVAGYVLGCEEVYAGTVNALPQITRHHAVVGQPPFTRRGSARRGRRAARAASSP